MRSSQAKITIESLIESQIPTFLWGAPGIGKSSIIKQIAHEKDLECIDLRLSLLDPTDLKGIPFYDKEAHLALWAPPSFLPREGRGILFLDELNAAAPAVQASAYQLILDRKVGEYTLPKGWSIVAAGNRESDRGVVYRLPSPLANRFVHIEMEVSATDWRIWALQSRIDPRLIAYIGFKNSALFGFDPLRNERSFATPRSWEAVHKILESGLPRNLLLEAISGAVGEDAAVDFLGYCKIMDHLPDIDAILRGEECEAPTELSTLYALSNILVSRILSAPDEEVLSHLLRYTLKLKNEFAVMIVQDLQRQGVAMEHLEAFGEWVEAYAYLL
ncbi:MAG: AAA family ATPase [Sulfuricurvum sp.]|uniref:AAA family ATPase n=1 Tax=Sulfuricurvum sp. TaxID=2025608 RepID=UPI00273641B3|nr:AAA family ATPase [Sulfuricurvum sp.]MDP3290784.1 AAA family ATPase [Sulfuricurvum sp.]